MKTVTSLMLLAATGAVLTGPSRVHAEDLPPAARQERPALADGFTTDAQGNLIAPPLDRDQTNLPRGSFDRRGSLAMPSTDTTDSEQGLGETVDQDDMDLSGFGGKDSSEDSGE